MIFGVMGMYEEVECHQHDQKDDKQHLPSFQILRALGFKPVSETIAHA
ncbi:protein of unknown function [Maridesulfovibrio hydrothermalis AM13 = DSM 14728]|uniref:Uncharacterized protein n=1 Tax=Maridesulfovibrio hydrothermalis AM13 = DSM 14728 TaxID=1121451 RepID=L0RFP7_9BACT|nr:protein of unknown function [Maridesulfovibrio hydrothermalis AM13 = DSM 14728]